jgi:phospholipid/cholesterol/gamma-HCH transport system substrate-binding protein
MKDLNKKKLYLGFFVVLTTILLIIALYLIGNRQNIFGGTFHLSAVFNNVDGLQLGNNVRYSGINVGTVKGIEMINDTTICVDMVIQDNIRGHMKKNAIASVSSDGLVGSMVVNIVPNSLAGEPLKPGDTLISHPKISTSTMLSTLSKTNENAAKLTANLLKITDSINSGKGSLGVLLNDATMAVDIKQSLKNIKTTTENFTKTTNELNKLISMVDYDNSVASALLSDSISGNNLKSMLFNLNNSSVEIDSALTSLNNLMTTIQTQKSAFNYIVKDTAATKEIDETLKNINKGSELLNENLEALKHSFLLRGYFKKQERKKEKQQKN